MSRLSMEARVGAGTLCVLLCAVLWTSACGTPRPAVRDRPPEGELLGGLRLASPVQAGGESPLRPHVPVRRAGETRDATVLIAPVAASLALGGEAGRAVLECLTAPVFNMGDGFLLEISLWRAGGRETVYRRYYDPGRQASDRAWIALDVPLELGEGEAAELRFELSGGPQGDLTADWLALASVRLVRAAAGSAGR
jgi:hypothetical protein